MREKLGEHVGLSCVDGMKQMSVDTNCLELLLNHVKRVFAVGNGNDECSCHVVLQIVCDKMKLVARDVCFRISFQMKCVSPYERA